MYYAVAVFSIYLFSTLQLLFSVKFLEVIMWTWAVSRLNGICIHIRVSLLGSLFSSILLLIISYTLIPELWAHMIAFYYLSYGSSVSHSFGFSLNEKVINIDHIWHFISFKCCISDFYLLFINLWSIQVLLFGKAVQIYYSHKDIYSDIIYSTITRSKILNYCKY